MQHSKYKDTASVSGMNQDLKKTLWATADKLRSSMDAAEYKHIVLGLIFIKYISDAFDERREQLKAQFNDPACDLYLPDAADQEGALEERDYYTMANVFWVPEAARWETLRGQAKFWDIGIRIDQALDAIEADNPRLKGILDKRFGRAQLEPGKLGELVGLVSTIGFGSGTHAKDVLGEVYEYFLGQFASAEGKKGGQFRTAAPRSSSRRGLGALSCSEILRESRCHSAIRRAEIWFLQASPGLLWTNTSKRGARQPRHFWQEEGLRAFRGE